MLLPGGNVLRLYCPVRCNRTPHAEMPPVHEDSVVGLGFCAVGSGCAVLTIQSALPAVSALLLSNRTRCTGVAAACDATTGAAARVTVRTTARIPANIARSLFRRTSMRGKASVTGG